MGTVNDIATVGPQPTPPASYLLDRSQQFGLIPTWSFWRDPANWRVARVPVLLTMEVAFFATLLSGISLPLYVVALIPPLALTGSLGLFERYIRRRARAAGCQSAGR
jgi:hypothetical protein